MCVATGLSVSSKSATATHFFFSPSAGWRGLRSHVITLLSTREGIAFDVQMMSKESARVQLCFCVCVCGGNPVHAHKQNILIHSGVIACCTAAQTAANNTFIV